jgi:glycosyltransferase involved in cell wall biosynthesis
MISIIMSTHNGRKEKCQRAIKSVLAQTLTDWELVIIDDASQDGTEAMVKSIGDERIAYIRRTKNFGCDTRPKNRGIKAAKYELITFLDSDNEYRPDHLAVLYADFNKGGADLVYGDRWVIDDEKRFTERLGFTADFSPTLLLHRNYIDTSDVLTTKAALVSVGGFDERYKKYVDWNLWLRMAKAGMKFRRVPLIITNYHTHSEMKSETVKDRFTDGSQSVPLGAAPVFKPEWDAFDLEIDLPYLHEVKEPRVAIFSITYDRLEYTKQCFESLQKTAGYPFEHIVFDNGSTDGTKKWLESNKVGFQYNIISPDNKGISKASNLCLEAIKKLGDIDIIVKVDNDCLFLTDGWLAKMVEIWKSNRMIALSCYVQGLKDNPGGAARIGYGKIKGEILGMSKHLGGICHFVDAKAYDNFRWDEGDTLHGVQDLIFSHHLINSGYQMGYLENYYCEHIEGTDGQHQRYPEYFERRKSEKVNVYGQK